MTKDHWTAVDRYLVETLVPSDPALNAALRTSAEHGLPTINVAPNQGKLLHLLALTMGAKNILEIGTLGGYSTIWLGRALPSDGKLLTLESDANKPSVPEYFTWSLKLSRPGSVIIVDNVVRDGKVIDGASKDASVQGVRRFMEMLAREPRVTATALQTVGAKGYDGFAMAVVT